MKTRQRLVRFLVVPCAIASLVLAAVLVWLLSADCRVVEALDRYSIPVVTRVCG